MKIIIHTDVSMMNVTYFTKTKQNIKIEMEKEIKKFKGIKNKEIEPRRSSVIKETYRQIDIDQNAHTRTHTHTHTHTPCPN